MIRHIRQIIYTLKHRYPTSIVLVQIQDSGLSTRTGAKSQTFIYQPVLKAVKMGVQAKQKFSYDLGYVHNNVNFTYGGAYNLSECVFLIDRKDLPADYEIVSKMYLMQGSNKFMVNAVDKLEEGRFLGAYMLTCTTVNGFDAIMPLVTTLNLTTDMEVVP